MSTSSSIQRVKNTASIDRPVNRTYGSLAGGAHSILVQNTEIEAETIDRAKPPSSLKDPKVTSKHSLKKKRAAKGNLGASSNEEDYGLDATSNTSENSSDTESNIESEIDSEQEEHTSLLPLKDKNQVRLSHQQYLCEKNDLLQKLEKNKQQIAALDRTPLFIQTQITFEQQNIKNNKEVWSEDWKSLSFWHLLTNKNRHRSNYLARRSNYELNIQKAKSNLSNAKISLKTSEKEKTKLVKEAVSLNMQLSKLYKKRQQVRAENVKQSLKVKGIKIGSRWNVFNRFKSLPPMPSAFSQNRALEQKFTHILSLNGQALPLISRELDVFLGFQQHLENLHHDLVSVYAEKQQSLTTLLKTFLSKQQRTQLLLDVGKLQKQTQKIEQEIAVWLAKTQNLLDKAERTILQIDPIERALKLSEHIELKEIQKNLSMLSQEIQVWTSNKKSFEYELSEELTALQKQSLKRKIAEAVTEISWRQKQKREKLMEGKALLVKAEMVEKQVETEKHRAHILLGTQPKALFLTNEEIAVVEMLQRDISETQEQLTYLQAKQRTLLLQFDAQSSQKEVIVSELKSIDASLFSLRHIYFHLLEDADALLKKSQETEQEKVLLLQFFQEADSRSLGFNVHEKTKFNEIQGDLLQNNKALINAEVKILSLRAAVRASQSLEDEEKYKQAVEREIQVLKFEQKTLLSLAKQWINQRGIKIDTAQ